MSSFDPVRFPLDVIPDGAVLRSVTAQPARVGDRDCLRVQLEGAVAEGVPGVDYIDQPTFVILPIEFLHGRIEVDIRSRLTADAPELARGFAGLAYRIADDCSRFESVYVRPLNGRKVNPPAPRADRAIQYFAYPEWPFDRIRDEFPPERFEAGADIGPDEWITLAIDVRHDRVRVTINGSEQLLISETLADPAPGRVGLFVDIGTDALFSNLVVSAK
jgi:hypothetical protein